MSDVDFPVRGTCRLPAVLHGTERTRVMGVVNVTPDSFSDGGRYRDPAAACAHAEHLLACGVDIIDVGGQSTRPGAPDLSAASEWERIGGVVTRLVQQGATVSVDTIHADTARRAIDVGAAIINDVSGGLADPEMAGVIASSEVGYVCQHVRGTPETMDRLTDYGGDVVRGVMSELADRLRALREAGVDLGRVIIDPGLGFGKTHSQSWQLAAATAEFVATGFPVLIGASRKRFLGLAGGDQPGDRDPATIAISALAAVAGAWAIRVHDGPGNVQAVRAGHLWKEHS